ncbi:peptidylprolyl isomerase [Alkaliphilus transvaalensis]|uniref:peptidylprolyl isomerase n=1 Tax=Alkaliphilus transvaalensis TaxID=114628 RepID=UPI000478DD70|nr:peptidylprolyl isomerase [Alkaliphilus transvaalensis]
MNIKKVAKVLSLLLVFVLFTVGCTNEVQNTDGNKVIATVNGVEIFQDAFDKNVALYSMDYTNEFGEDVLDRDMGSGLTLLETIKEQVLEKLIIEELLMQLANENNITVEESVIKEAYKDYQDFLKNNDEFRKFSEKNGIDETFIKNELKKDKVIRAYQDFFMEELKMDYEKAKKFYDENPDDFITHEVKASHILVSEAELADELYDRIMAGESFEDLATEYSEDPGSASRGGDLGFFPRGVMIQEFESVAFALEVGGVSLPVNSVFGYHIIRKDDERSEMEDFEIIKDELVEELQYSEFQRFVEDKLDQADIERLNK